MDREITVEPGLIFNVSTLLAEPLGSLRAYAVRDAPFRLGEGRIPVSGQVRFTRTDGGVLVEAVVQLMVEEVCVRCLEPFGQALSVDMHEEFWPDYDPLREERPDTPDAGEGFAVVAGLLDLQEPLRQYVEMTRPMQAICRSSCPGAGDGANAGTKPGERASDPPATSDGARIDHRWAALEELRDELG